MKKLEVVLYIFLISLLAFLNKKEYIDEVSVGLAVSVIGLARGFVYQKEQTKKEREEKKELKHQIELFKAREKKY